ncbi:MAG: T9SS type A sorting domain-containing protein [Flavobacteriales bacterium]|nr:T9SS type A sorting domain-containing protein [Flavobacteriales bacterium]
MRPNLPYSAFKILLGIALFAVIFNLFSHSANGQTPFNGMSIQEVAIDPAVIGTIDAALPGASLPRCWRVYICMDDPDYELQAIFGDNNYNWICTTTTNFYQSLPNSNELATGVNPAFFGFIPASVYDSWFTIGLTYTSNTATVTGSPDPFPTFEAGNSFIVNDNIGTSVIGLWLPPLSEGRADADNKLLIAQITTDGIFSMNLNFQFRRLNSDGTIYFPITTPLVTNVFVDGTPGAEVDVCPIVFLSTELLSFKGEQKEDQVNLYWSTASETNNDFFTIERSQDGVNYEEILQMDGAGTTSLTNHYTAIDSKPLPGVSYYRLKQTDFNGEFEYTDPISVDFTDFDLTVYPNPAHDQISISGDTKDVRYFRFRDASGQLIREWEKSDGQTFLLGDMNLSSGVYFVEMEYLNGFVQYERLVVR